MYVVFGIIVIVPRSQKMMTFGEENEKDGLQKKKTKQTKHGDLIRRISPEAPRLYTQNTVLLSR